MIKDKYQNLPHTINASRKMIDFEYEGSLEKLEDIDDICQIKEKYD